MKMNDNLNTRSPIPSVVLFISQLKSRPQGNKVRFLGCVESYDEKNATLELFHHYPKDKQSRPNVLVNITAILDSLKNKDIEVGAWVNVIGYIAPPQQITIKSAKPTVAQHPTVQAIMLWSAGIINLAEYENSLTERQRTGT